jgi:GNAT superfamily N-acetyltransferase
MPPPDIPHLRALTAGDLLEALALSTSAGWNQQLADWRLLQTLAAGGGFAAVSGRHVVGTALAIDYGGFAWIAMMLVEPGWRGRGVGARLLDAAMQTVPANRHIRLDATEAGRPLYLRHGFREESLLTRLVAPAARAAVPHDAGGMAIRPLTAADLPVVAEQDTRVFGGDRRQVLEWALGQAPQYALMADREAGRAGYTFGRPGRLFDQVGPVVAADDASAIALVSAALGAAAGRSVVVDAFDARPAFVAWLHARGFAAQRPLFRMRRPPREAAPGGPAPVSVSPEYAILGPDFA